LKVVIYAQRPAHRGAFRIPGGGDVADLLLTYPELTRVFPAREGTLRAWVSEDGIEPKGLRGRRKVFSHDDIQAAYDRRHPDTETEQQ
jgi:hypothetical protein